MSNDNMAGLMKDKIVLVTGSSAGIGEATAIEFAKHGAKLVITGRNQAALGDVARKCLENGAPEVESVVADISTDEGIDILVNATMKKFGTLHILVNNAGATVSGSLKRTKGNAESMDKAYNLLLRSPWKLSGRFVDELIKNKGNIVNISSGAGITPIPPQSPYCIMKAGLDHMTRCMATELGMHGVRVNCISPGAVHTKVLRNPNLTEEQKTTQFEAIASKIHLLEQKVITPEEVAQSIIFFASEAANRITGVILPVDCGSSLASPGYDFARSQGIPFKKSAL